MTTWNGLPPESRYPGTAELLAELLRIRRRRRGLDLASGGLMFLAVAAGGLLVVSLCGYFPGQPSTALRWGLLILLLALVGGGGATVLARLLLHRTNPAQTARYIETHLPELRNDLINSVLLAGEDAPASPALVQCAIRESLLRAERTGLQRCVPIRSLGRPAVAAGLATLLLAVFALLQPGPFRRGVQAVFLPGRYVPVENDITLVRLIPGDAHVLAGQPVTLRLEVRDAGSPARAGVVFADRPHPRAMFPVAAPAEAPPEVQAFQLRIEAVQHPLQYAFRLEAPGGRGRWPVDRPWFQLSLRTVALEAFEVRYEYPPYLGWDDRTQVLRPDAAALEAPEGTLANLHVRFSDALPGGVCRRRLGPDLPLARREGGREFRAGLPIREENGYRLLWTRDAGAELFQLPVGPAGSEADYPIRVQPDAPPAVSFLAPNRDVTLSPGAALPLRVRASDAYGLRNVQLWAGPPGREANVVSAFPAPTILGKKEIVIPFRWTPAGTAEGDEIAYYATATDNRRLPGLGGPQTATTETFKIRFRSAAAVQAQAARRYDELQKTLLDLLQRQSVLRGQTQRARRTNQALAQLRTAGQEIRAGQSGIRDDLDRLVKTFPFDVETDELRRVSAWLVAGEARLAVDQAQALAGIGAVSQCERLCAPLAETQDAILSTLQEMLAILPILAHAARDADSPDSDGGSPEARRRMRRALQERLAQFIDEQTQMIQAGRRLSAKPPDDFTPDDKTLLRDQVALQEAWEAFLHEAFTDFSKLARQDFANPSLLKELLSIKTDVTLAKDALEKQAVEIATAAEDNSVENAKELTANIEKWLPDEPDRKKWNMEAAEEQQNIEQAELFTELEDLVGDLLEEEEDLFEEMDDLTGQAAMSGDKGIGWGAEDGPISNMNAQGVTGNQLPNTSEISGRSGEGRTGKSSGEFVEDKAIGKGGRRTPTRISPEPFQKGRVRDVSTDPVGGATGGGKQSGVGAEGLEGPGPAQADAAQPLLGRQASLIRRAEHIAARFSLDDYSAFRFRQAILLMNRVRRDLHDEHYRNALRRRSATLRALRQTRRLPGREIDIVRDPSRAGPATARDELTDTSESSWPTEYRDALQQYYQRLSERGGP